MKKEVNKTDSNQLLHGPVEGTLWTNNQNYKGQYRHGEQIGYWKWYCEGETKPRHEIYFIR